MTYEQIKQIASNYSIWRRDREYQSRPNFDEWAQGPGKELLATATFKPNVEQPSNVAPVSPDNFYCAEYYKIGGRCEEQCNGCKKADNCPEPVSPDKENECPECGGELTDGEQCKFCTEYEPTIKHMEKGELGAKPIADPHEKLVREIAEEMLPVLTATHLYNNIPSGGIEKAAHIAVEHRAKGFKEGHKIGYRARAVGQEPWTEEQFIDVLRVKGLIPGKEGGQDAM